MLDDPAFARRIHVDMERLHVFIDRGWISPLIVDGRPMFGEIDIARAALIDDLVNQMGVNDDGIDLVLDLVDQLYSLRFALNDLIDALEVQPRGIRRLVVEEAQRAKRRARSHPRVRR